MEYILCKDCKYWASIGDGAGKCYHPDRQNISTAFGSITNVSENDYCALGCAEGDQDENEDTTKGV